MSRLTNPERSPYTDVIKLTYVDLQTIGTGGTLKIANIPTGGGVSLCTVVNTVDIVGSTSLVIDIGTTLADPDEFINALDVDGMTVNLPTFNTGDLMVQAAGNSTYLGGLLPVKAVSADTPVYIKVTDAAIASITAGEIVIGLQIVDLLKFNI